MKIHVTGASGFIGRQLVMALANQGHEVTCFGRKTSASSNASSHIIDDLNEYQRFSNTECDVFIHLAAASDKNLNLTDKAFFQLNADTTLHLAKCALRNGCKQFIFLSSAKVHGEYLDDLITVDSPFVEHDNYSRSKIKAEQLLMQMQHQISLTVLRPPIVYGANPKKNIAKLIERCRTGKPIPLPSHENKRSFLHVDNLISAIQAALGDFKPGYRAYLLDDQQHISMETFIKYIGLNLDREPQIIRIPNRILWTVDKAFNISLNREPLSALHQNFYVSSDRFSDRYDWQANYDTREGVKNMLNY